MSDGTMIERVARAIDECNEWPAKTYRTRLARAAIEAMREPTEGMVEAGVKGIDDVEGDCATEEGTRAGYLAMIDTALTT